MNTLNFGADERQVLLYAIGNEICAHIHAGVTADMPPQDKTMSIFKSTGGLFELRTLLLYTQDGCISLSDDGVRHLEQLLTDVNEDLLPPDVVLEHRRLRADMLQKFSDSQILSQDGELRYTGWSTRRQNLS